MAAAILAHGTTVTVPKAIPTSHSEPSITAKVTYVFDGDTIEIAGGTHVRYIGMNTPELGYFNTKKECFGPDAARANKALVLGKTVRLVSDTSNTDMYGRLLRYVYVDLPAQAGNVFINDYLVRQGYAVAEPIKPDIRLAAEFYAAQQEAQKNQRGLWSACPHPRLYPTP